MTTCTRRRHSVWTTCACPPCTADRNRKAKLARNGHYRRVPSEAAWAVVDQLAERGWTGQAIASAAGVPKRAVERALEHKRQRGTLTRFGPTTAAAIVAAGDPTAGSVGAHGSRRRLQGLARQGWDLETLAERSGVGFSTLAAIRSGGTSLVRARYYLAIRGLAEGIGAQVGPSQLATKHAERKGWVGLFAWDDLDDPHEQPATGSNHRDDDIDDVVVQRLLAGDRIPSTRAEKDEAMRQWKAAGRPERQLCQMHGWKDARYGREEDAA